MSRGLTQEQKDYLDKVMKEYRQRTGTAMGSIRRLADQDYDEILEMNDFESIYPVSYTHLTLPTNREV